MDYSSLLKSRSVSTQLEWLKNTALTASCKDRIIEKATADEMLEADEFHRAEMLMLVISGIFGLIGISYKLQLRF